MIRCLGSRNRSSCALLFFPFTYEAKGQQGLENAVRNLPVECGRMEKTVGDIISEIQAAPLFDVNEGEVSPEPLAQDRTHPWVS